LSGSFVVGTLPRVDLYLMRHGEAGESSRGDAFRPLTARGRAQASSSAKGFLKLVPPAARPTTIWHSPYLRAAETAALAAAVLGVGCVEDERFTPDASPDVAAAALLQGARARVLVVAHLPILPALVFTLGGGRVDFGTATIAHLGVTGGAAVVVGLWSASHLEHLA
jgi:phosphohistidine phosphatase